MNEVFLLFLSLSLSGGLVFLLVMALKLLFKSTLSKQWQYYILLIVILRFIVPFGPETSLIGGLFSLSNNAQITAPVTVVSPPTITFGEQAQFQGILQRPAITAAPSFDFELLWFFWLAGVMTLFARKIFNYHRSIRTIVSGCEKIESNSVWAIYRKIAESMHIRRVPSLFYHKHAPAPMVLGLLRPIIILPQKCPDEKDLHYILRHELTHFKRFDILYKWLMQITVCLHFYNPVVYYLCREVNRNCELSCDEAVLRALDKTEKYAYGNMLLNAIHRKEKALLSPSLVSVHLNEDSKLIKERLVSIMQYKKITKITAAGSAVLAVCLIFSAIYFGTYQQPETPPETTEIAENEPQEVTPVPTETYTVTMAEPTENPRTRILDQIKAESTKLVEKTFIESVAAADKLEIGPYTLEADTEYTYNIAWDGNDEPFAITLTGKDGVVSEHWASMKEETKFTVPENGEYSFFSLPGRANGDIENVSAVINKQGNGRITYTVDIDNVGATEVTASVIADENGLDVEIRDSEPVLVPVEVAD